MKYLTDVMEESYVEFFEQKEEEHKTGKLDMLLDKLSSMAS